MANYVTSSMPLAGWSSDTVSGQELIAKEIALVSKKATIATGAGANLKIGTILGKITASGKYTIALQASADGSQTPDAVLAHDVDATAADKEAMIHIRGGFNRSMVIVGAGLTLAGIEEGLRGKGIFLIPVTNP